jgi:hypothetical protein
MGFMWRIERVGQRGFIRREKGWRNHEREVFKEMNKLN